MAGVSSAYSCHHVDCYNSSPLTVRLLYSILRTRQRQRFLPSHPAIASQSHREPPSLTSTLTWTSVINPKAAILPCLKSPNCPKPKNQGHRNSLSQVSRSEFLQGEPHPYALRPHHPSCTPPPSSGPRRHSRSKWTLRRHQTNRSRNKRQ